MIIRICTYSSSNKHPGDEQLKANPHKQLRIYFPSVQVIFLDKRPSGPALLKKQGVLGMPVLQDSIESTTSQNESNSRAAAWRLTPSNSL
jgi:hypothetical protein